MQTRKVPKHAPAKFHLHLRLDRIVAVKLMRDSALAGTDEVRRFKVEAAAAAKLKHPHIVAIHEVGEQDGQYYFAMDLVEGGNLAQRTREGPLAPRAAAELVATIADAVQHAHERGVLHRDLKPSNVLIDGDDQPFVTDFGLARTLEGDSSLTLTGQVLGTPGYMPPEQATGNGTVGPAADIYSLGALLYHLLTGRAPFVGGTPAETMRHVVEQEPVSPQLLNPGSPRDLAVDLERFGRGEPTLARPTGATVRLWRWCQRERSLAGALALCGLIAVLGMAGILWQWRAAVKATEEKQKQLWASQLLEARYHRTSGRPGHRQRTMEVIERAAAWRPSVDLRNEAIASLLLPDVGEALWERPHGAPGWQFPFDAEFEHYMPYSARGDVVIHQSSDHAVLARFKGLAQDTTWAEFSPDGQRLAVFFGGRAGETPRFGLWDWRAGKLLVDVPTQLTGGNKPAFAFTSDGREIALASKVHPIRRFDVATGEERGLFLTNLRSLALRFSEDGKLAVLVDRSILEVWNPDSGVRLGECRLNSEVNDFAWHPNGAMLGIGLRAGVATWKLGDPEPTRLLQDGFVTRIFFNPTGDLLIGGGWGGYFVSNAERGNTLLGKPGQHPIQLSRDGTKLALVNPTGSFSVHPFLNRVGLRRFLTPSFSGTEGIAANFHPSGRWLLTAHGSGWLLWDVVSGRVLQNHSDSVHGIEFLTNGTHFLTSGASGVREWPFTIDSKSSRPHVGEPRTVIPPEPWRITRIALAPDGSRFAALGAVRDTYVGLIRERIGTNLVFLEGYTRRLANFVHFSPDGRWVMTGAHHGAKLNVYDASNGRHVMDLPSGNGYGMFQARGNLVFGKSPADYGIWRLGTWELVRRVPWGAAGLGSSLGGVSPDDRYYFISDHEGQLRLRDLETDRDFATFIHPNTSVWSLRGDATGTQFAGTSSLSDIAVWNLRELRRELARLGLDWPDEHPGEGFRR